MSALKRQAANDAFGNPVIDVVLPQQLLSTSCRIATIDCVSVSRADLQNVGDEFRFESMLYGPLTGFVLWFTAVLLRSDTVEEPIVLDTGPHYAPTHWAQTVLYLKEPRDLRQLKQGQIIGCAATTPLLSTRVQWSYCVVAECPTPTVLRHRNPSSSLGRHGVQRGVTDLDLEQRVVPTTVSVCQLSCPCMAGQWVSATMWCAFGINLVCIEFQSSPAKSALLGAFSSTNVRRACVFTPSTSESRCPFR